MLRFALNRLLQAIPVLLIVISATFSAGSLSARRSLFRG